MKTLTLLLCVCSMTFAENSLQELQQSTKQFTVNFYKELAKSKNGNLILSPFSGEAALAWVQLGAKGPTAEEISKTLSLPNDKNKTEEAFKKTITKLKENGPYTLKCANKIFVKESCNIHDDFKRVSSEVFGAEPQPINFVENVKAAKTMNDWVESQTNHKIKDLISSNDLDDDTRAVLINALYFKGDWSRQFSLHNTKKGGFHITPTKTIQHDLMHHWEVNFKYYECPHLKAQFLELPFKGEDASMVIVLPNEIDGLARLESQLDQVFSLQQELGHELVNVAFPAFKLENKINLKEVLTKLGVKTVFDEDNADLSGIGGQKGDLYVSDAIQKTFIDVNESGVEAAAASIIHVGTFLSALIKPPKNFIADHPFIFYIKVEGFVMFAGRVVDPSK